MRVIPRKTKVRLEFLKGITIPDIILAFIGVAVALGLFTSNFAGGINYWIGIVWVVVVGAMFFKLTDGIRFYTTIGYLFKFLAQKKVFSKTDKNGKNSIKEIIPFQAITQDRFIDYGDYCAAVIEVTPLEFGLLTEDKQNMMIEGFANAIRRIANEQSCSIVKLNKAMILDNYVYSEDKKYDQLLELQYEGEVTETEVERRAGVFEERVSKLEQLNRKDKIYKDYFYLVLFDKDKEALDNTVNGMINTLVNGVTSLNCNRLYGKELAVFMRANYGKDFDERNLESISIAKYPDWAMPEKIRFQSSRVLIDDKPYRTFVVTDYPLHVANAWGATFFLLDRTKVVMKFKPVARWESEKQIDKAIMEMESKLYKGGKSSKVIENQTHLDTLRELLVGIKNSNQQLYDCNTFITCEESARKEVRAMLKQEGFKFSEMFARQIDAFVSGGISKRDNLKDSQRGIPTSSLAAIFPFISGALQDPKGFYIGYNEYPVFVDFFKRDRERVNSNMMVIGKSGSGKSYATKTLLTNFAADNTKIFILDPEEEYTILSKNLGGKMIDVGSSQMGIINPFHIITSLEADEGAMDDSFSIHLQFLEQFFKVILEGIDSDSFEMLNSAVVEIYKQKKIEKDTPLKGKMPKDFPVFDDLYAYVLDKIEKAKSEYHKRIYMTIETYIKKFASGGRNSNLWNGPTSIQTKENFITFNFRSLLANKNEVIASAQMLLVFKYLDNEIIKNKDFNEKFKSNRKIIVAVDEAHVFINPKFPIALDFMANMAKRIRKYAGMQIVITQNIKDFVGSPEIQRQSTAVINASQYSLIFALAPNDMNDLIELYERSGGINEEEQNAIVTAGVGQAFLITSAMSRSMVQIEAHDYTRKLFSSYNEGKF